jgi:pimeloyl-ACP methyl ester carboxylesterase
VARAGGQRIAWQQFGAGDETILLLPTWSIVHSDFWRHQVPVLAQQYRVITFDGLGNGASDRPLDPALYGDLLFADDAVAVLDACGVERAAAIGVSAAGPWTLALAGRYPERVSAAVFIGSSLAVAPGHPERAAASATFDDVLASYDGWSKWNRHYWLNHYEDFLRFFFGKCFTEPDSQSQIEHFVAMGLETTPEVLLATEGDGTNDVTPEVAARLLDQVRCPTLVIHGDADAISPLARGQVLARLLDAELIVLPGSGHEPQCRAPDLVNAHLETFLEAALSGEVRTNA